MLRSMQGEAWISEEARMASTVRRVFARALHRPLRVLTVAALVGGAIVGLRAITPPFYRATLHFRLAEGEVADPTQAPRPPSEIRQYLWNVVLSRSQLERIMRKYRYSTARLEQDPIDAVDRFREEIQVDVARNYFIYERRRSDPPRSAQVTISLLGDDAEQTQAMLHEMGEAFRAVQRTQRVARLEQASELFRAELTQARARTKTLQDDIRLLGREAARAGASEAIAIRTRMAMMEAEIAATIDRALALEARAAAVALSGAAEEERLGLDLQPVDEQLETFARRLAPRELALLAAVVFPIVLLLTVCVSGAFDDRVYAPEDLATRGLPLLGSLARFPGDDSGSYGARSAVQRGTP